MRPCSPTEFVERWPGSLQPCAIPDPAPTLPADCIDLLTRFGLPRELTIVCYNDITLTFSGAVTPLAQIWERDLAHVMQPGKMPAEWQCYWHLADQEYTQGGGWICLEEPSGRLVVIDLDQPTPIYLLNASLRNFYTTLAHFLQWSGDEGRGPADTLLLRDALQSQDCISPEELEPFWMNFVDATLDYDPMNLGVFLNRER